MKFGQGNVFTSICLSTGGMSASVHAGIPPPPTRPPWTRHPQDQAPPRADTSPEQTPHLDQAPPQNRHAPDQAPPRADTPQSKHPTWTRHPPQNRHAPDQTPPGPGPPGSRLQHTVNERPVRMLLECILVQFLYPSFFHQLLLYTFHANTCFTFLIDFIPINLKRSVTSVVVPSFLLDHLFLMSYFVS